MFRARWRVMTMLMRSDENSNNDSWWDLIEEGNGFLSFKNCATVELK